jgi:hypothetical protein
LLPPQLPLTVLRLLLAARRKIRLDGQRGHLRDGVAVASALDA